MALVIGNGSYRNAGRLDNAVRDAATIAKALRDVGFDVQTEQNLSRDNMVKALRRFEEKVETSDWSLLYYADHGIEVGGTNYLVPVDATLKNDRDVGEEAVSLSQVQSRMSGARKLRLVILDACRDNPFLASMKRTFPSRSVDRGLGRLDRQPLGSVVAYSAAAGETTSDGAAGASSSPYLAALIKNLAIPDLEVNLFFRLVREDVLRATDNKQEPATYESLPAARFVFRPISTPATSAQPSIQAALPASAALPPPRPVQPPAQAALPPPVPGQPPTLAALPPPALPSVAPSPSSVAPPAPSDSAWKDLVGKCDRLAASSTDPDRPSHVRGISKQRASEAVPAIAACKAAIDAAKDQKDVSSTEMRRLQFQLGRSLFAVDKYREAEPWLDKAANLGSASAMYTMGVMTAKEPGAAPGNSASLNWYKKAAAAGHAEAMKMFPDPKNQKKSFWQQVYE